MTQISECLRQHRQIEFRHESKWREYIVCRGLETYLSELPKFQGKTLAEIIDEKIIGNGKFPVQILDIGCGEGNFLLNCKEKWESHVDCVGLSAFPYHEETSFSSILKEKGVDIKIGDVHRLYDFVPQNNFDVVTCSTAFRYFADPATALKMIYQTLRDDGVCFINDFKLERNFEPYADDSKKLYKYLEKTYEFEFHRIKWGVSFKRQSEKLSLPISFLKTVKNKYFSEGRNEYIVYQLKNF